MTIRKHRSQSFAIYHRLEHTTIGCKHANTIGTGWQAESWKPRQTEDADNADAIPQADKNSHRMQSMIMSVQYTSRIKT
ncbi:hypothetical protein H4R20_006410, partial [Coemansia guatemalensis]